MLEKQQQPLRKEGGDEGRKQAEPGQGERCLVFLLGPRCSGVAKGLIQCSPKKPARGILLLGSARGHCPLLGVGDRALFCCAVFISMFPYLCDGGQHLLQISSPQISLSVR